MQHHVRSKHAISGDSGSNYPKPAGKAKDDYCAVILRVYVESYTHPVFINDVLIIHASLSHCPIHNQYNLTPSRVSYHYASIRMITCDRSV